MSKPTDVLSPGLLRAYATVIGLFPLLLAVGIVTIPVVVDYSDHASAQQATQHSTRWLLGHLLSGAAFSEGILAACCIAHYLRASGRTLFGATGAALIVLGAALHTAGLGADGIGPLAISGAGGSASSFFDGSSRLLPGVFMSGAVAFGAGLITLAIGLRKTTMLRGKARHLVLWGAILFPAAEAIPSGYGLYIVAAAGVLALAPVSRAMWVAAAAGTDRPEHA